MSVAWRELESSTMYAWLAVELINAHDGTVPRGRHGVELFIDDGAAGIPTGRAPRWLRPNLAYFPYVERHGVAANRPDGKYLVKVVPVDGRPSLYRPGYEAEGKPGQDAVVWAWDEQTWLWDPNGLPTMDPPVVVSIPLLPRPSHPWDHGRVVRGYVRDVNDAPLADILIELDEPNTVTNPRRLRVLSERDPDRRGEFALPVPRNPNGVVTAKVTPPGGPAVYRTFTLPFALRSSVLFNL